MGKSELSLFLKNKGFSSRKINNFFNSVENGLSANLHEDLSDVREVILWAVKKNGHNLYYASDNLKADREVVLIAVSRSGRALQFASEKLRNDKELVLIAVRGSGYALSDASLTLRGDKDVVLAAFKNNKEILEYASEGLRDNKDFLLNSIFSNNLFFTLLKCVSKRLRNDPEVALSALLSAGNQDVLEESFRYLSKDLQNIIGNTNPIESLKGFISKENLTKKIAVASSSKKGLKI